MNNGSKVNPIVVGRVATEPSFECKGADKITTFRLSDSDHDKVTYHSIVSRGKQATVCKKYLHIGDLCCVEGTYNSAGDAILADRVTFLRNKG